MTLADDLRAARALIDTPEKWTREAFERHGCFCAVGAVEEVTGHHYSVRPDLTDALAGELPDGWDYRDYGWDSANYFNAWQVMGFNDAPTTTHADILALFDRAILAAEHSQ